MNIIEDWFDFVSIIGLSFFLILVGVWTISQLPEHVQFYFALSILCSAVYFTKQLVFFIKNKFNKGEKIELIKI